MKPSIGPGMLVIALTGFATLAEAQTVSASWPHYTVTNLGTLGGAHRATDTAASQIADG
jgi:hypothetical protein